MHLRRKRQLDCLCNTVWQPELERSFRDELWSPYFVPKRMLGLIGYPSLRQIYRNWMLRDLASAKIVNGDDTHFEGAPRGRRGPVLIDVVGPPSAADRVARYQEPAVQREGGRTNRWITVVESHFQRLQSRNFHKLVSPPHIVPPGHGTAILLGTHDEKLSQALRNPDLRLVQDIQRRPVKSLERVRTHRRSGRLVRSAGPQDSTVPGSR